MFFQVTRFATSPSLHQRGYPLMVDMTATTLPETFNVAIHTIAASNTHVVNY